MEAKKRGENEGEHARRRESNNEQKKLNHQAQNLAQNSRKTCRETTSKASRVPRGSWEPLALDFGGLSAPSRRPKLPRASPEDPGTPPSGLQELPGHTHRNPRAAQRRQGRPGRPPGGNLALIRGPPGEIFLIFLHLPRPPGSSFATAFSTPHVAVKAQKQNTTPHNTRPKELEKFSLAGVV